MTESTNITGKAYHRPWGYYKTLELSSGCQVKMIEVNPNGQLSLQSHKHRAEHWIVVSGEATVTVDNTVKNFPPNSHIFIPIESKHRLENFTDQPVQLIEVQVGDYLGEDDIIRYEDVYGRG